MLIDVGIIAFIRIILALAVPLFKAIVQSFSHRRVLRTRSVRRRAASF
jgi:hypothetical protein